MNEFSHNPILNHERDGVSKQVPSWRNFLSRKFLGIKNETTESKEESIPQGIEKKEAPIYIDFKHSEEFIDKIGNPDDYQPTGRSTIDIFFDREKYSTANRLQDFDHTLTVVYKLSPEGLEFNTYGGARELATMLNTVAFGNAVGTNEQRFYASSMTEEKLVQAHPESLYPTNYPFEHLNNNEISHIRNKNKNSILFYKLEDEDIPLLVFTEQNRLKGEEDLYTKLHLRICWLDGSTRLAPEAKATIDDVILKFCQTGFPILTEIKNSEGEFIPNPLEAAGTWKPKKKFLESEAGAKELRDASIKLISLLSDAFDSNNINIGLIGAIDQQVEIIHDIGKRLGVDVDHFPDLNQELSPVIEVVSVISGILENTERFIHSTTNWDDVFSGDAETVASASVSGLLETDKLSEAKKDALYLNGLLGYAKHRLAITREEIDGL